MSDRSSATLPTGAPLGSDAARGDAEQWFTALDQRLLSVDAERWLTQVVGIHQHEGDVWIQLQPLREQLRDFTIRVRPGMSVDEVVTAVEAQIRHASGRTG